MSVHETATQEKSTKKPANRHQTIGAADPTEPVDGTDPIEPVDAETADDDELTVMNRHQTIAPVD